MRLKRPKIVVFGPEKTAQGKTLRRQRREFQKNRAFRLKILVQMIRTKDRDLDPELVLACKKFSRLPFAFINDSCAGHLSTESCSLGRRLSFNELRPGQKIYCSGADFEIQMDGSPAAIEFMNALGETCNKFPFVIAELNPELCTFGVEDSRYTKVTKQQAGIILEHNQQFIRAFSKLVDRFVAKYGVPVDLS
jgi:hypothetical protein